MTPKDRRARLLRQGKPVIRPMGYEDVGWLWADYIERGETDFDQAGFRSMMDQQLADYDHVYVIEDRNSRFANGAGPVGVVVATADDWVMEPHVHWLAWARKANRLRGAVAFFMAARYSGDVGVIRVHSNSKDANYFHRLKRYVPLYRVGKIPGGRPDGTDHVFYVRGKKQGMH